MVNVKRLFYFVEKQCLSKVHLMFLIIVIMSIYSSYQIYYATVVLKVLANEKVFYKKSIHSNFKDNRVKWIVVNIEFVMLYVCKTKTTHLGATAS